MPISYNPGIQDISGQLFAQNAAPGFAALSRGIQDRQEANERDLKNAQIAESVVKNNPDMLQQLGMTEEEFKLLPGREKFNRVTGATMAMGAQQERQKLGAQMQMYADQSALRKQQLDDLMRERDQNVRGGAAFSASLLGDAGSETAPAGTTAPAPDDFIGTDSPPAPARSGPLPPPSLPRFNQGQPPLPATGLQLPQSGATSSAVPQPMAAPPALPPTQQPDSLSAPAPLPQAQTLNPQMEMLRRIARTQGGTPLDLDTMMKINKAVEGMPGNVQYTTDPRTGARMATFGRSIMPSGQDPNYQPKAIELTDGDGNPTGEMVTQNPKGGWQRFKKPPSGQLLPMIDPSTGKAKAGWGINPYNGKPVDLRTTNQKLMGDPEPAAAPKPEEPGVWGKLSEYGKYTPAAAVAAAANRYMGKQTQGTNGAGATKYRNGQVWNQGGHHYQYNDGEWKQLD